MLNTICKSCQPEKISQKIINGPTKDMNKTQRITGKDFKLSGDCAGCCPPWEVCSWPCPDAIN
jgi:hypothetical protein